MSIKSIIGATCLALVSFNANAVVINTLNGIDYEWLELTETAGLSRNQVEARLDDVNDVLYGYEYASRQLVEDLFLSYTSWNGLNGYIGESTAVYGVGVLLSDLGALNSGSYGATYSMTTADGYLREYDSYSQSYGMYGTTVECGSYTCLSRTLGYTSNADPSVAWIDHNWGYNAGTVTPLTWYMDSPKDMGGSYLVKVSAVPVPAAVWLFGSGLLGLVGIARRKKR